MMRAEWYDATYFDGPGKSNYARYDERVADFDAYADALVGALTAAGEPTDGPVLDVGCAKGFLVAALRRRGVRAYGVDWSAYAIDRAAPGMSPYLYQGSATALGFMLSLLPQDARFALCCSFDLLEHFDEEHARAALREMAAVSRHQFHQVNTGWAPTVAFDGDQSHVLRLPLDEWRRLAREEGCRHTTIVETGRAA